MNNVENSLEFSIFIHILKVFGVIRLKENVKIADKISSRILSFFFILSASPYIVFRFSNFTTNSIMIYCYGIDRLASTFCALLIFLQALILSQNHGRIFEKFNEIDEILINLKIKNNSKFLKLISLALLSTVILTLIITQGRFLIIQDKLEAALYFYSCLILGIPYLIEAFYILIVVKCFSQFYCINKFLGKKSLANDERKLLGNIFIRLSQFIDNFNKIYGFTILLIIGKI